MIRTRQTCLCHDKIEKSTLLGFNTNKTRMEAERNGVRLALHRLISGFSSASVRSSFRSSLCVPTGPELLGIVKSARMVPTGPLVHERRP